MSAGLTYKKGCPRCLEGFHFLYDAGFWGRIEGKAEVETGHGHDRSVM
jgi:hypothetical protein